MKRTMCSKCEKEMPFSDSYSYEEQDYCEQCIESISPRFEPREEKIFKNIDPTICATCGLDNGEETLPLVALIPTCTSCRNEMVNRKLPLWVKSFLFFILLSLGVGLYWNGRYYLGFLTMREAEFRFDQGDLVGAASLARKAFQVLPDFGDYGIIADLYQGLLLLYEEDVKGALALFESLTPIMGQESSFQNILLNTKIAVLFDEGDYVEMYEASSRLLELFPEDPFAIMTNASAAAAVYASTKNRQFMAEAEEKLSLAFSRLNGQEDEELAEYEKRIRYRLRTGEIIDSKEYYTRFPRD